jgi:hypothetical protein
LSAQAAIEILLYSGLVPAAVALATYFAFGWLLPEDVGRRYRLPSALALGVFVGMAFLPTTKSVLPERFWEWIPYLGLLAAFACGLTHAAGVTTGERWIAIAHLAALTAWKIVPTWDELAATRPMQIFAVATGIALLTMLVEPLATKLPGRLFPVWLFCAAGTVALLILGEVSETFGRLAALPASALLGCGIASWLTPSAADWRTIGLPYAALVGGYAFTGFIYPTPPLWPLLFVPFAPLALWICTCGPLGRLTGPRAVIAQAACVLTPLVVVAVLLLMRSAGDEW